MWIFLCVCFTAAFFCGANGQDTNKICNGKDDFAPCPAAWDCNLDSQCFCKSEAPYCRCNNYIDEFYIGKDCSQKWTTLTFALVATLPGVTLAVVIGVSVHLAHRFRKPSKSHGAENDLTCIPEQDLFPGVVFASDLNSPPSVRPLPGPTPGQVGLPMVSSRPYSVSDNTQFLRGGPPMGSPTTVQTTTGALYSLPPSSPTLSTPDRPGSLQTYSYTGGGAQVFSNPYARARNPYEERNMSAEPYNPPASPRAYEEQRMASPPSPPYGASEHRSAFPRAQIGRPY